jgi:RNA polymerase primary sigma factor
MAAGQLLLGTENPIMTMPSLLESLSLATATRDDIDLPLLERDFNFLPTLCFAELRESTIDFDAFTQQSLLSADIEAGLFRQMHLALFQAAAVRAAITSAPSFPRADLDELLRLANRADRIRNTLATVFSKLALSIAAQFANTHNPLDELMSESHEAVLRAVAKFDPDRSFRFSTYLTDAVRRQLLRFLQRRQRDRQRTFSTSDDTTLPDTGRWTLAYEQRITRNVQDVERLLLELNPRDRYVIRSRFGWGREFEPRTLQEIAAELGVTRERVRQLEQRALKKLTAMADAENMELA